MAGEKAQYVDAEVVSEGDGGNGDRDKSGRFVKGNSLGKGNPQIVRVAALRREALSRFTPKDVVDVLDKMHRMALSGDVPAARVFLSYAIGQPQPAEANREEEDEAMATLSGIPKELILNFLKAKLTA